MIKYLKESTDVTKSNRQLAGSFVFTTILCLFFVLARIFIPLPRISGTLSNIIAIIVVIVGVIIAVASCMNIKKWADQTTSNKTLLKAGFILLYSMIYIPLVLLIPETISTSFQIEGSLISAVIRGSTGIILLIPAFIIYKKIKP